MTQWRVLVWQTKQLCRAFLGYLPGRPLVRVFLLPNIWRISVRSTSPNPFMNIFLQRSRKIYNANLHKGDMVGTLWTNCPPFEVLINPHSVSCVFLLISVLAALLKRGTVMSSARRCKRMVWWQKMLSPWRCKINPVVLGHYLTTVWQLREK